MKEVNFRKLLGAWCLFMLSLPVAVLWIGPDFDAPNRLLAFLKIGILLALVSTAGLLLTALVSRQWSSQITRFTEFVADLPAEDKKLAEEGPREVQNLSRSMHELANRVRHLIDQANLESARRDTILACMAEGVLAVDANLRVIFCNEAFARAFRTRVPAKEGISLYELVRETLLREILERVLSSGSTQVGRFQLPSASGRWFEARALPFSPSKSSGAIIALHDITDIQEQERLRKDFVADVSHELRTPLAAIRGYAETLLDGGLEDIENNRRFVEVILAHAIRLNDIASDLLVLSELDSHAGPPLTPDRISLLEVIQSAINTVSAPARARQVTIDSSACEHCVVRGVRFRLEQALVNLLDNAVKFNRLSGQVIVECGYQGDKVQLSVSDTGIGIPSGEIDRIFERFYRVDKARSRPAGGTGLGLPIVKEVIGRMGGTVSVESQLGRGSKFTLTLSSA